MFAISDVSMQGKNGSWGTGAFRLNGGSTTAITFAMKESNPAIVVVVPGVIVGGTTIATTVPEPITVQIGGLIFTLALDPANPKPGEFTFVNGIITLVGYTGTATGAIVRGYELDYVDVPTTRIVNPDDVLRRYNAIGSFSAKRSLEGHPSASLELIVQASTIEAIRSQFRNNREVDIYGVGYRVASVSLNRLSEKLYPGKPIGVSIEFKGKWESWGNPSQSPLDQPIKLRSLVCGLKRDLTVADLCAIYDVSYAGPRLLVKVQGTVDRSATTTIRQEIEQTAENHGGFVYWSNPNAIEVRVWGVYSSKTIPNADVLNDAITYNINGEHDVYVDGTQLSKIYDQCRWQPESSTAEDSANPLTVVVTTEFDNALADESSGYDLRWPPGYNQYGQAISLDNSVLRNPSNNWDSGGPTKTKRRKITVNGESFSDEEDTYGFVFTTDQTYKFNIAGNIDFDSNAGTNNPASYWQLVERKVTQYKYDADNYLIGTLTMGQRLARPRQETEALEMIRLQQELNNGGNPDDVAFLQTLFTPKFLPINGYSTYTLAKFSDYYSDIEPETKDDTGCDDSRWVEPKFVRVHEIIDNSVEFGDNPESTSDEILPAIAYGKNFKERTLTTIVIPESKDSPIRKPERHSVTDYKENEEGQALKDRLVVGSSSLNDGRPSVQARVEPSDKITAQQRQKAKDDLAAFTFWFSCGTEINTSAPEKESLSFTYVDDPEKAQAIAALRLAKENTQNALTTSINVRYRRGYEEGDTVLWDGKRWRILGVDDNQEISDYGEVNSSFLTLSLGHDLRPTVRMEKVAAEDYKPSEIGNGGTGEYRFDIWV